MDAKVKEYIEKYKDLIESNDWKSFYAKVDLTDLALGFTYGDITKVLLQAGINPLKQPTNLAVVPYRFLESTDISSFSIPEGIKEIGIGAFLYCVKLKSIEIPNSVTRISVRAFEECKSLADIFFNGTKEQWGHIKKVIFWNHRSLISGKIHCIDGDLNIHLL